MRLKNREMKYVELNTYRLPTKIDLTPTWGQWGTILFRFAVSGKRSALETLRPDMAKAFALAEAFKTIQVGLNSDQLAKANTVIDAEMPKQGIAISLGEQPEA